MIFICYFRFNCEMQVSVKKSLDLVGEKMSSTLLPDTALLDSILDDEGITDPLEFMNKVCKEFPPVTLAEGKKINLKYQSLNMNIIYIYIYIYIYI